MTDVTLGARAPGKLFLTGEWAVLRGAPAIVAAVDRYATVDVTIGSGPAGLVVEGAGTAAEFARPEDGELPGGDAGAVLAAHRRAPWLRGRHVRVAVDARSFVLGREKLGLGRSAATLTAAMAAFLAAAGRTDRAELLDAALAAHADFQSGHGSGADVAAAVHGGVIEVRRAGTQLATAARALPPGLQLVVGYTGAGAATEPLLRRFAAGDEDTPALTALAVVAERAADAVARADAASFVAAVDATGDLLARLGRERDVPIVTPPLARLVAVARRLGVAAKPAGAGGGDCGIAFATSTAEAEAVRAAWRAEGIVPLPIAIATTGVEQTQSEPTAHEVSLG